MMKFDLWITWFYFWILICDMILKWLFKQILDANDIYCLIVGFGINCSSFVGFLPHGILLPLKSRQHFVCGFRGAYRWWLYVKARLVLMHDIYDILRWSWIILYDFWWFGNDTIIVNTFWCFVNEMHLLGPNCFKIIALYSVNYISWYKVIRKLDDTF